MNKLIEFFTLNPAEPLTFWAQIIGFIPLSLSLLTFSLSKRSHILISKTFADLTSAVHFFLLGEVVGGAVCVINTARGCVFYQRGRSRLASHISVPIIFCILTLASSFIKWEGIVSLLPTCGSILAVIGFWFSDPRLIKLFNLPAVTLWLIYSIIIGSISATIINIFSITTIIISAIIDLVRAHRKAKNATESDEDDKDEA